MSDLLLRSEFLREAAARFNALGNETEQMQRQLEAAWRRLDAGWEDYAETGITGGYSETMNEISRMVAMLSQMAEVLRRVADLLEQSDAKNAAAFGDLDLAALQGSGPLPQGNPVLPFPPGAQIDDPNWWLQFQNWLNQLNPQSGTLLLPILLGMLPDNGDGGPGSNRDEPPWWAPIVLGLADGWNWYHENVNQPIYDASDKLSEAAGNLAESAILGLANAWFWYDENINQRIYDSIDIWKYNINTADFLWNKVVYAHQPAGLPADGPLTPALQAISVSPVGLELANLIGNRGGVQVSFLDQLSAGGTAGVAPFKGWIWLPNDYLNLTTQTGDPTLVAHELEHILQRDLAEYPDGISPAGSWPFSPVGFDPFSMQYGAPMGNFTLQMEVQSNIVQKTIQYDLLTNQLATLPPGDSHIPTLSGQIQTLANELATFTGDPTNAATFVVQNSGEYSMYVGQLYKEIQSGADIPHAQWGDALRAQGFSDAAIQHIEVIAATGVPIAVSLDLKRLFPSLPAASVTPTIPPTSTPTATPTTTPTAPPTTTPTP